MMSPAAETGTSKRGAWPFSRGIAHTTGCLLSVTPQAPALCISSLQLLLLPSEHMFQAIHIDMKRHQHCYK